MKVLWLTNILFPDACKKINVKPTVFGGWMHSAANELCDVDNNIELGVATSYEGVDLKEWTINGITYYLIPNKKSKKRYQASLEEYWKILNDSFKPDITHIHGTEYPYGLEFVNACGSDNVVVSIQGLVSVYERYYYGGIDQKKIRKSTTLRDYLRFDTLFSQRKDMQQRGQYERALISSVNHVIGRTSWDKAHIWEMNRGANYYFCNETLRREFYEHSWSYDNCESYSIFLSQGYYPIKGLHQIIKALPIILRCYPDTKVYVAGRDFVNKPWWRLNGYGRYLKSLMKKLNVRNKINFTGLLNGAEMRDLYLKSNVFVCPSAIENSPNSVGEAQVLGVPVVASYVGGTPDMIAQRKTGILYRYEEVEMLAKGICSIFRDEKLACELSNHGKEAALSRHDPPKNAMVLNNIYESICKD